MFPPWWLDVQNQLSASALGSLPCCIHHGDWVLKANYLSMLWDLLPWYDLLVDWALIPVIYLPVCLGSTESHQWFVFFPVVWRLFLWRKIYILQRAHIHLLPSSIYYSVLIFVFFPVVWRLFLWRKIYILQCAHMQVRQQWRCADNGVRNWWHVGGSAAWALFKHLV